MTRQASTAGSPRGARRRPRAARAGFWRAVGTSTSVHAVVLGAGVAWGLFSASGESRRVPSYAATFVPSATPELPSPERERLEPTLVAPEAVEPALRESEVWDEPEELFALEEPEPEVLGCERPHDWIASRPFEIGVLSPAPGPDPAPERELARVELPAEPLLRVDEPVPLTTPPPAYPRLSRRAGEEGSVLCSLELGVDGSVLAVEILESSGHPRLDLAAREALVGWRFEPRREAGAPVAARILHRVTFRLRES